MDSLGGNEKAISFAKSFDCIRDMYAHILDVDMPDIQSYTAWRSFMHPLWKWFSSSTFNHHLEVVNSFMESILNNGNLYKCYLQPKK